MDLHNEISCTVKRISIYWSGTLYFSESAEDKRRREEEEKRKQEEEDRAYEERRRQREEERRRKQEEDWAREQEQLKRLTSGEVKMGITLPKKYFCKKFIVQFMKIIYILKV